MLREELAGYGNYAAKVRYRLIPGVWQMRAVDLKKRAHALNHKA